MPYFSLNIKIFMSRIFILVSKVLLVFIFVSFQPDKVQADETEVILKQLQILQ